MKIKFLGTNSRAKMAHPRLSIDSLTPPPEPLLTSLLVVGLVAMHDDTENISMLTKVCLRMKKKMFCFINLTYLKIV